jgi:hypothetical protein
LWGHDGPNDQLSRLWGQLKTAHEGITILHRRLRAVEGGDEIADALMAEAAKLGIGRFPAVAAKAKEFYEALAAEKDSARREALSRQLADEMDAIEPELVAIIARHREIAENLRSRLLTLR